MLVLLGGAFKLAERCVCILISKQSRSESGGLRRHAAQEQEPVGPQGRFARPTLADGSSRQARQRSSGSCGLELTGVAATPASTRR